MEEKKKVLKPFLSLEGQDYNEYCVVFKDLIDELLAENVVFFIAYRALISAMIDSSLPEDDKHELLSSYLGKEYAFFLHKNRRGLKFPDYIQRFHEGELTAYSTVSSRWIIEHADLYIPQLIHICLLLSLVNTEVYENIFLQQVDEDRKNIPGISTPINSGVKRFQNYANSYKDEAYCDRIQDLLAKVFPADKSFSRNVVKAFFNHSTNDLTEYICENWNLAKDQLQMRLYGARRIETSDKNYAFLLNTSDELVILHYVGNEEDIVVPSYVDNKPVVYIFNYAFSPYIKIVGRKADGTDVIEPVQSFIGKTPDNLDSCKKIKTIEIPDSIRSIGKYAFIYMDELESIKLSEAVNRLPSFDHCKRLKKIIYPSYVCEGTDHGGVDSDSILYLIFPEGITYCPSIHCQNLKYLSFPDSLEYLTSYCLSDNPSLEELYLPCETFAHNLFDGCTSLRDIYLPKLRVGRKDGINLDMLPNLVIHGFEKSKAEEFAKRIGAPFVADCSEDVRKKLFEKYKYLMED